MQPLNEFNPTQAEELNIICPVPQTDLLFDCFLSGAKSGVASVAPDDDAQSASAPDHSREARPQFEPAAIREKGDGDVYAFGGGGEIADGVNGPRLEVVDVVYVEHFKRPGLRPLFYICRVHDSDAGDLVVIEVDVLAQKVRRQGRKIFFSQSFHIRLKLFDSWLSHASLSRHTEQAFQIIID